MMVIANDTPYPGLHADPLCLKHAAATKLAPSTPFDGEPCNVHLYVQRGGQLLCLVARATPPTPALLSIRYQLVCLHVLRPPS
jgi:hypothetical protein